MTFLDSESYLKQLLLLGLFIMRENQGFQFIYLARLHRED